MDIPDLAIHSLAFHKFVFHKLSFHKLVFHKFSFHRCEFTAAVVIKLLTTVFNVFWSYGQEGSAHN